MTKLCKCGRAATHYIMRLTLDGDPDGKQLACDGFPSCAPVRNATAGVMRPESTHLIDRARRLALEKPSTSYIQRHLGIGYNHACELMEHFEAEGLISKRNAAGHRTVLTAGPGADLPNGMRATTQGDGQ